MSEGKMPKKIETFRFQRRQERTYNKNDGMEEELLQLKIQNILYKHGSWHLHCQDA
ncbi:penicillin-binding protein 1A [Sesbania bispinosa]|nr:penicillin-binding protein 1A [Sesbania bispinosa]